MSEKNTLIRSAHDIGLAAWFGGALMGAVGLNGAAAKAKDPKERLELSSIGWGRWAPVNAAAIGVHAIGGAGLIAANKGRLAGQPGARANTLVKLVLTVGAAGLTAYSGKLGRTVAEHASQGGHGSTEPSAAASPELQKAQKQLKITQWAIPAVTGVLLVMGANQGEQQRPKSLLSNQFARVTGS
jgi:hypothetical protein